MHKVNRQSAGRGFIALIAVVILSSGIIAFSFVTMSSAIGYAENVSKRELRIQAGLNRQACLDTASIMIAKDFFLSGTSTLKEFDCEVIF